MMFYRRACAVFLGILFACVLRAEEMSPAMRSLCQRAESAAFIPRHAPRPSADPLFRALATSDDETILSQALGGTDPNALRGTMGMTALSFAVASGNVKGARLLLARGAQIDLKDRHDGLPFEFALTSGRPGMACLLVQWGAKVPSERDVPFLLPMAAVSKDDPEGATIMVDFLANHGHDINARVMGDTALLIAAETGNLPLVRLLLKRGADINAVNKQHENAEAIARRSGNLEIAKLVRQWRSVKGEGR
ncbi:MAG: ankyrin repeat domain-containing protein [Azonexus sp.]|jgi:ankyrin repeat protein|uniref:ankyrin repeat domain-containing protein n=1 Tax=Azonexus sp. TaxID=1872668 RepID=UPI00281A0FD5|nr:ankyrin repeat domain-containing protein [Azonexus sp.]MDR0777364.1 ankyrin repeat domain-containing protein [Azonexus sp.]